jgi:hypothetical protein
MHNTIDALNLKPSDVSNVGVKRMRLGHFWGIRAPYLYSMALLLGNGESRIVDIQGFSESRGSLRIAPTKIRSGF